MRRKRTADPLGYGRLLDAWIPPASAGEALGCLATTFTFNPSFFETECLGRMLQLESDPDANDASYLIEREEKMARLLTACVVVDQSHARGNRSLRWDLIPFKTKTGILHAKLSLLLWQHHARVIVTSANLTENGYRQNLEVFSVWDFHREGKVPAEFFGSAADFASEVLAHCQAMNPGKSPALERSREFLTTARRRVNAWLPSDLTYPRLRSALVSLTPKSSSVLDQLKQHWPSSSPPKELFVLSPFFDLSRENLPAKSAWELLRQRGEAEIIYSVVAEPIKASGKLLVHAPISLAQGLPDGNSNAYVTFERIKMPEGRPLHAKSLWVQNDEHYLHCIGSSNFTSAGLGLTNNRNWELNVATWARCDDTEEFRARNAAWPEHEKDALDPDSVEWEPYESLEDTNDPNLPLLPDWCGSAVYFVNESGQGTLELNLGSSQPDVWSIFDPSGSLRLIDSETWRSNGALPRIEISWGEPRPPAELVVRVAATPGEAKWPVEVRCFSDLPPPQELRDLSLEQLLEILTSALPLHRCLQKLRRRIDDGPGSSVPAVVSDPLRRYARDTHLLERTRRFSLAMTGIRQRLESPIPSEEYLQWRLQGPIGVAKVAAAIVKEAGSDGEKALLLGELALEISQVKPKDGAGCLPTERIQEAIRKLVLVFEQQAEPLLSTSEASLRTYVQSALRKARQ